MYNWREFKHLKLKSLYNKSKARHMRLTRTLGGGVYRKPFIKIKPEKARYFILYK